MQPSEKSGKDEVRDITLAGKVCNEVSTKLKTISGYVQDRIEDQKQHSGLLVSHLIFSFIVIYRGVECSALTIRRRLQRRLAQTAKDGSNEEIVSALRVLVQLQLRQVSLSSLRACIALTSRSWAMTLRPPMI